MIMPSRADASRIAELAMISTAGFLSLLVVAVPIYRHFAHRGTSLVAERYLQRMEKSNQSAAPQQADGGARLKRISQRNIFAPPVSGFQGMLNGVLGDAAIFDGGQFVRQGESHRGAKITAVGPDWVEIEWEGVIQKLYVFGPPQPGAAPASQPTTSPSTTQAATTEPAVVQSQEASAATVAQVVSSTGPASATLSPTTAPSGGN